MTASSLLSLLLDNVIGISSYQKLAEPAFELAAALRNLTDEPPWAITAPVFRWRVDVASEQLGIDCKRYYGWTFFNSIFIAMWAAAHRNSAALYLAAAATIKPFLRECWCMRVSGDVPSAVENCLAGIAS